MMWSNLIISNESELKCIKLYFDRHTKYMFSIKKASKSHCIWWILNVWACEKYYALSKTPVSNPLHRMCFWILVLKRKKTVPQMWQNHRIHPNTYSHSIILQWGFPTAEGVITRYLFLRCGALELRRDLVPALSYFCLPRRKWLMTNVAKPVRKLIKTEDIKIKDQNRRNKHTL